MTGDDEATRLRAVANRWMDEVWKHADLPAIDRLHTPTFVDHNSGRRTPDLAGFRHGVAELYKAFPDFYAVADAILIDVAQRVVTIRWSASAMHQGQFMGVPPTHRRIHFRGIEILRIDGERIAERWGELDALDLLAQLAAAPVPPFRP